MAAVRSGGKGIKVAAGKKGGVVIRGFKPSSFLGKLGLKSGDTVVTVGSTEVKSAEDLSTALRNAKNPTAVKIQRKKKELTINYTVVE